MTALDKFLAEVETACSADFTQAGWYYKKLIAIVRRQAAALEKMHADTIVAECYSCACNADVERILKDE